MFKTSSRWLFLASALFLSVACEKEFAEENLELAESALIIGQDDRQLVTGPRTSLDRTVGQIIGQGKDGKTYRCSATSIKGQYILTAAHCFYNADGIIQNAYFYPSIRLENTAPFGRFPILSIMKPILYNSQLETLVNIGFDIAVAKVGQNADGKTLEKIIGGTGWWGLNHLPGHRVSTVGYPGDKPNSTAFFQNDCFIDDYTTLVYETECDVFSGQSGSPVVVYHEETKKKYVIGVIVGENQETNLVVKMTPERQRIINAITAVTYLQEADQFLEKWETLEVPLSRTINILINNTCNQEVRVAYTAQKMNKEWQTYGFLVIKPYTTVEIKRTPNGIYRLHAHLLSNMKLLIGDNYTSSVPGSTGQFKFSEFRLNKIGDRVHTISHCL